ncbi:MAG: hypothetical protein FJ317_04595 [SAR202 cluster bacterium]|nr:hypothetical protein [SAR202 cluster bacterium]
MTPMTLWRKLPGRLRRFLTRSLPYIALFWVLRQMMGLGGLLVGLLILTGLFALFRWQKGKRWSLHNFANQLSGAIIFSFIGSVGSDLFQRLRTLVDDPTGRHYADFFVYLAVVIVIIYLIKRVVDRIFKGKRKKPEPLLRPGN